MPQYDYIAVAEDAARNAVRRMERVEERLQRERKVGTVHRQLEEYVGVYVNGSGNWRVEIGIDGEGDDSVGKGKLWLRFQGREDEQYAL
jgi:hypothetical protein